MRLKRISVTFWTQKLLQHKHFPLVWKPGSYQAIHCLSVKLQML